MLWSTGCFDMRAARLVVMLALGSAALGMSQTHHTHLMFESALLRGMRNEERGMRYGGGRSHTDEQRVRFMAEFSST